MLAIEAPEALPGYVMNGTQKAQAASESQHTLLGFKSESKGTSKDMLHGTVSEGIPSGPTAPKPIFTWDEQMCERVLRAQLRTVDILAYDLSVRPCLFIITKFRRSFINVYIQQRSKWSTVILVIFVLLSTLVIPSAVAHSLVPYECYAYPVRISEAEFANSSAAVIYTADLITARLVFERSDCEVFKYLLDWLWMLIPGAISLLLVIVGHLILERPRFRVVNTKIAYWIRSLMPKIYMSGLGSSRHPQDSAWHIMNSAGLPEAYSFAHDYFGAAERARLVFLVGVINTLGSIATGFFISFRNNFKGDKHEETSQERATNVVLGVMTGLFAGLAIMRLTFSAMNEVLGASDFLIQIIESELKAHQPHQHALVKKHKKEVDRDKVRGAVESALHWVETAHFECIEAEDLGKLVEGIYEQGEELLQKIASWLTMYSDELNTDIGACFGLFKCMSSFACTEHELAALTFLDMRLFLVVFFDEDWSIMGKIHEKEDRHSFTKKMEGVNLFSRDQFPVMRDVYISYPDCKICTQKRDGFWEIKHMKFDWSDDVAPSFLRYGEYKITEEAAVSEQYRNTVQSFKD